MTASDPIRLTRGSLFVGGGAVMLAVASFLPWYTLPGDGLEEIALAERKRPIPPTGSAWHSFGITATLIVALALIGVILVVSVARKSDIGSVPIYCAVVDGTLIVLLMIDRLFVQRPGGAETVLGAGSYLGLLAAAAITLGALLVAIDRRAPAKWKGRLRQPPRAEPTATGVAVATPAPKSMDGGLYQTSARSIHVNRWALSGLAATVIVAVYLATRLSFVARFPYFFDELLYATWTAQGAQSTQKLFVSFTFAQGPLDPWLAILWVKLGFGPLTAVRLVSVTSGLLTVVVLWLLARRLGGTAVGWVAAALCVLLPFFLVHDSIGIYEPLVTLIMASALYLQLELARGPSLWLGVALGLVLGAGIMTKQNTLPALALLPVSLVCFDFSPIGRRHRLAIWVGAVGIAFAMVIGADLVLHSSSYYRQLEACRRSYLCYPARSVADVLKNPFGSSGVAWAAYRPALTGYVTLPLIATSAIGALLLRRARPRQLGVLLAWIVVPFLIALLFELRPYPRHVMYVLPPAIVLMAYAIVHVARWAHREAGAMWAGLGGVAAGALLFAPALVLDTEVLAHPRTAPYPGLDYFQYVDGWTAGGPWQGIVTAIRRRGTDHKIVILTQGPQSWLELPFWHDRRYVFVTSSSPLAPRAQLAVYAGGAISSLFGSGHQARNEERQFAVVRRFSRPSGPCSGPREQDCGGAVTLLQRSASP